MKKKWIIGLLIALTTISMTACQPETKNILVNSVKEKVEVESVKTLGEVPEYSGSPYAIIDNNKPTFSEDEFTKKASESYSDLDSLGRCGIAYANIGKEIMPTEERGKIGMIKPSGWQTVKYDNVDGKYLYNRCHLIGFQLSGENANEKNLITGTRYMNVEGMLPFENQVADYVRETGNHVLYRVTPVYEESNLLASGVIMEAASVEDEEIRFHVYCYNVQPGIEIDYVDGSSKMSGVTESNEKKSNDREIRYIGNKGSKILHRSDCESVAKMKSKNKVNFENREDAMNRNYTPCKSCNP